MNRKQRRASAKLGQPSSPRPGTAIVALLEAGLRHQQAGQLAEAEACYRQVLAAQPDNPDALHLLGLIAQGVGRPDLAIDMIGRAVKQNAQNPLYHSNLGLALASAGQFAEAVASYDRALALMPDFAEALNNRGHALQKLQRFEAALASFDGALAVRPSYIEALNNRGSVLYELKRFDEALADYQRALTLKPDFVAALYNRGNALQKLNRFEEAIENYDRALALKPDYAEALNGRGVALKELGRLDEALQSYQRAIALKPDDADAHWNEAIIRLLKGDFEQGFVKAEWRWKSGALTKQPRTFVQPSWLGLEPVAGKTVLLHSDEGLGDAIHFARYIPLLAARGARVIVEIEPSLRSLLSGVEGIAQCLASGDALPAFDLHCSLSSLPRTFGTQLDTIPAATPYLRAPSDGRDWETRLGPKVRPRIGLVWSGNSRHKNDHNRSAPLTILSPLFDLDALFVSLQKDVRAEDAAVLGTRGDVLGLGGELTDFADTAALISCLDLVITVDTSVAHLAGALGRPVWILLPFIPDWRWLLGRDDSPWYPTARLFRQSERHDWAEVIERMRGDLSQFVAKRCDPSARVVA